MSSRIEQIIEEIEEYVESCKYQPLSTTKIVVNKEENGQYLIIAGERRWRAANICGLKEIPVIVKN